MTMRRGYDASEAQGKEEVTQQTREQSGHIPVNGIRMY